MTSRVRSSEVRVVTTCAPDSVTTSDTLGAPPASASGAVATNCPPRTVEPAPVEDARWASATVAAEGVAPTVATVPVGPTRLRDCPLPRRPARASGPRAAATTTVPARRRGGATQAGKAPMA
jgi:hypothetical protein